MLQALEILEESIGEVELEMGITSPSQAFTEISFPFRHAAGKHVSAGFMILMPGSFSLHPPHPGSES